MDLIQKYAAPLNVYVGLFLIFGIAYVGKLPDWLTWQANTMLGRLLLFGTTIIIASTYSWVYSVMMALFTVLVLACAPRTQKEGFANVPDDTDMDVKLVTQKKRWWSEVVLGENPIGIEEEKVRTSAIQDSASSNSTNSSR